MSVLAYYTIRNRRDKTMQIRSPNKISEQTLQKAQYT